MVTQILGRKENMKCGFLVGIYVFHYEYSKTYTIPERKKIV